MRWALGIVMGLALAGAAQAATTVSFYSHGWGVGLNGFTYFPHAFVVIERDGAAAGDPPRTEAWGYTAASTTDLTVLMHPSRGLVEAPNETYRKHARLHFSLQIGDAQYQALEARIAWWGAATSPPYSLDHHDCMTFVGDLAQTLGLKTGERTGRDPGRYLEQIKRLNPERLLVNNITIIEAPKADDQRMKR
jgi:hypothetical protein